MADFSFDMATGADEPEGGMRAGVMMNVLGAAVSLALVAGIGTWGYRMVVRDVSGVPVVRAMGGPMRAAPSDPGGEVAAHIGLAVNAVAAEGTAAPTEDRVVLAPRGVQLAAEDMEAPAEPEALADMPTEAGITIDIATGIGTLEPAPIEGLAGVVQAVADAAVPQAEAAVMVRDPDAPLSEDEILALADRIAASVPAFGGAAARTLPIATVPATVPGVARSIRPALRPMAAFAVRPGAPQPLPPTQTVSADSIAVGTDLVQLGAFETPEIAQAEWERLRARFADFMGDKAQVIQEAQSGGRTFYRLRATGFGDLADARRFCSALVAENAACIPVVVR